MKIDWQWPAAMVFCVVFLVLGVLVYFGKVPHDGLYALLAWLIPSPAQSMSAPSIQKTTITEEKTK